MAQEKTKKKNTSKARTSNRYCPICHYKVRGANHTEGTHHKSKEQGR